MIVDKTSGRYYGPEDPLGEPEHLEAKDEPHFGYDPDELAACAFDFIRLADLGFDVNDPEVVRKVVGANRRRRDEQQAREARRIEAAKLKQDKPLESVVYYMRVGNRVKIGYSTNLESRVNAVMPEEVLATEPGGPMLESVRHRQFAELREAREWFRMEGRLLEHVEKLRGNPCATS